jgi:hypothetical protein
LILNLESIVRAVPRKRFGAKNRKSGHKQDQEDDNRNHPVKSLGTIRSG